MTNTLFYGIITVLYFFGSTACQTAVKQENQEQENVIQDTVEDKSEENLVLRFGDQRTEVYLPMLEGKSVAVVANQTSVIDGVHLVDTLISSGVNVKKVFAPEHGFRGNQDAGAHINDEVDEKTGLPLLSLHGKYKKPSKESIEGIDVIVFDIQDVGVRFYTYISTLHYVMEAAAENGVKVIVLDRPNPHDYYVDGPVLENEFKSFVGMHNVPVVYGMTIGEYGVMINGEKWLKDSVVCDLTVVHVENYNRGTMKDMVIPPSPNLPNMHSIKLYPSLCFFEGTYFSAGRGTDFPFQVYGAPDYSIKEYSFKPISKPGYSKYPKHENKICYGKDLRDSSYVPNGKLNWSWLIDAYQQGNKTEFFLENDFICLLAGTNDIKSWLKNGLTEDQIRLSYKEDLESFSFIRSKYLIYP